MSAHSFHSNYFTFNLCCGFNLESFLFPTIFQQLNSLSLSTLKKLEGNQQYLQFVHCNKKLQIFVSFYHPLHNFYHCNNLNKFHLLIFFILKLVKVHDD